ncbi:MAG: DUF768 domain-containing protein [Mesorhizobium sp.]|uniref:DUF768 domain-containing protein n=1 Tax=unclassified Mesorhizobium TaxID=325217 RepID=UPI000FCC3F6B|nr:MULTISPECIES: DUF768 domain-containing protein [unclassified Mesorhizobium]RUV69302.1 DUF768 domain-containing protein [Mesorhizobium sp. M5C.F.Cr.IN.023.01.1.1]RWB33387.1 MAG: DUF768 domain-containing protein [Mesorhizobium sp.]RWB35908.1 MAG: DUF768 domain-containing protein [Mesorhizobium sp.]RWB77439.1 MAG: DUF768 domain-containing protein [Mesorhizobium sp.]RWC24489.1 MAG: DUF768 domain-containing protein [Mesorhizobium sp.]
MSATKEFFETWLQENVGNLPAESEVSVAVLAQQFEQDADAAGYGHEVREDEIGDIEEAIEKALDKARTGEQQQADPVEESDLAPVMEALEVEDPKSGP